MESEQKKDNEQEKEQNIEAIKMQYQIERLKKIDEQNRKRSSRYLNKHYEQGKRQISALISQEAFDIIQDIKAESIESGTPLTVSDVVDSAVLSLKRDKDKGQGQNNNINVNVNNIVSEPEQQGGGESTPPDKTIDNGKAFQLWIFNRIKTMREESMSYQQMADKLNAEGQNTLKGVPFGRKNLERIWNTRKSENVDAGE